ncbi:MAG: hypothetical protein COY70_03710, partial [Candidatus Magasanikbacteria bacterium CG_4_10_14_0_8_um_filter_42_12]
VNGVLPAHCSNTCTWENTCDSEGRICDPATDEGCTSSCILGGSSLFYSTPSVCGDGVVGLGEYAVCEDDTVVDASKQGGLQLVTAIGEGETIEGKQSTEIRSSIPSENNVAGIANYTLQCGFAEYDTPQNGFYNDCALPVDGEIGPNGLGVASNSCCYQRSFRTDQYPDENQGFVAAEAPLCRNTYIEVTFDAEVDPQTIVGNAIIARGYETAVNCAELGGTNVTDDVASALSIADGSADASSDGFWSKIWHGIKQFFQGMIQRVFAGNLQVSNMRTWCSEGSLTTDIDTPAKTIPLYISQLLGSQTADSAYAVLLRGGKTGIRDIHGVGIKHKTKSITSDAWAFEVGTEICKIDHVAVDPQSYLFSTPNTSADFGVAAITKQGQQIVSTPAYSWRWEWQPQGNTIFNIPAEGTDATAQFIKMGSTNVEGTVTALAQAIVTEDVSATGNQLGNRFEGQVALTSMFCENPWPARADDGSWAPFVDDTFNYSFSYCADAGVSGSTNDDLPFIKRNDIVLTSDDVLKRILFVSDTNTDALGIQIFANPERLSVASWFADKFPNAPIPQKVTLSIDDPLVSGYDVIADQDNYYINAFNVVKDDKGNVTNVYSNIYLFTISQAAQASTRDVFQQIIDTLEFNINLTDYGYCLGYDEKTPDFEHACTTNFDCLLGPQIVVTQEAQNGICEDSGNAECVTDADCSEGVSCWGIVPLQTRTFTSAGCSAEKTQLFRDLERLRDVETIQSVLGSGPYPALDNGTFRPNYVASVWSSWGLFGTGIGANLPRDPINVWSGCGPADAQTCWDGASSTFVCPQQESVYEYSYNKDTGKYTLHMPFEFFKSESQIEQFFAPSFISDTDAFTTARECQPGQTYTFIASACGDGVVGPGEQCDPPGSSVVSNKGVFAKKYGTCEYATSLESIEYRGDAQCLHNSECDQFVFDVLGKTGEENTQVEKVIYTGGNGNYCGDETGGIFVNNTASNIDTNTYVLFSCNIDADCANGDHYIDALPKHPDALEGITIFDTVDLGAFGNKFELINTIPAFQTFQKEVGDGSRVVGCFNLEENLKEFFKPDALSFYDGFQASCVGAIQDGQLLSCQTNPQEFAVNTCNNSCQWDYGSCEGNTNCPNGRVDPGETCDDGGLNGQYGQCNNQCNGLASSCGDGNLDDEGYEKCDWSEAGFGLYSTNKENSCSWDCQDFGSYCGDGVVDFSEGEICDLGVSGVSLYNIDKELSCSSSCQQYGSYCGDNVIDTEQGETCDDGNNTNGDGCNNACIVEEGTCSLPYPQDTTACIVGQNMCPYVSFGPEEDTKVIVDSSFTPVDTVPGNLCAFKDTTCIGAAKMSVCNDYYHMLYSRADVASSAYVYGCSE